MNNLFFWIIILCFVVPTAPRLYRKSVRGRSQNQGMPRELQGKQPRDGYTQQDYFGGGFRQGGPGQQFPGQQSPVPYEDSPEYLKNPPPAQQPPAQTAGPAAPPPSSSPQGFRARKLAELDQRYSNGELALEDYMAQRAEIMKG